MRLPPEILSTIFRLVQLSEGSFIREPITSLDFDPSWDKSSYGWMRVTRVWCEWRDVAASCATLWKVFKVDSNRVDGKNNKLNLPAIFLKNSVNVPLDVYIHCCDYRMPHAARAILEHLPRIRMLNIEGDISKEDAGFIAARSAPLLEAFSAWPGGLAGDEDTLNLLTLFASRCPNLRSLALTFVDRYSANTFTRLTQLQLGDLMYASMEDLNALIDLLCGTPRLEDLAFLRISKDARFLPPSSYEPPLLLPRLKRLAFSETKIAVVALFINHVNSDHKSTLAVTVDGKPFGREPDSESVLIDLCVRPVHGSPVNVLFGHAVCSMKGTLCMQVIGEKGALQFVNLSIGENVDSWRNVFRNVTVEAFWFSQPVRSLSEYCTNPLSILGRAIKHTGGTPSIFIDCVDFDIDALFSRKLTWEWWSQSPIRDLHFRLRNNKSDIDKVGDGLDSLLHRLTLLASISSATLPQLSIHFYPAVSLSAECYKALEKWRETLRNMSMPYAERIKECEIYPWGQFPVVPLPETCRTRGDGEWEWPRWVREDVKKR